MLFQKYLSVTIFVMIVVAMSYASASHFVWKKVSKYETHIKKIYFLMINPTLFQNECTTLVQRMTISSITKKN